MPICVLVLKANLDQTDLSERVIEAKDLLRSCQLVQPCSTTKKDQLKFEVLPKENTKSSQPILPVCGINAVKLLNPKLARRERQKTMAFWLMPFGFIAGIAFTNMTGLTTFQNLGLGSLGEPLIGGLLGMGSGLIGSFAASGSANEEKDKDVKNLRKKSEEGKWLLILETPVDVDLPWNLMQEIKPLEIVRLNQL